MSQLYEWSRASRAKRAAAVLIDSALGAAQLYALWFVYCRIFGDAGIAESIIKQWYIPILISASVSITQAAVYDPAERKISLTQQLYQVAAVCAVLGALVLLSREMLSGAQAAMWIFACVLTGLAYSALVTLLGKMLLKADMSAK